jgi:hypothetical protein
MVSADENCSCSLLGEEVGKTLVGKKVKRTLLLVVLMLRLEIVKEAVAKLAGVFTVR